MKRVCVSYKNKNLETVAEREYGFQEYVDLIHLNLLRVITDVESFLFSINHGKEKSEWPEEHLVFFNTVKHKLLDEAGSIQRLPSNLKEDSDVAYDFWKNIFGENEVRRE